MRKLILTCEHAGNRVPAAYTKLFSGQRRVLDSHRGWDPGSLSIGKTFQRQLNAPLLFANFTRLLVEPNRSLHHRRLFSEFTADLAEVDKQTILDKYYHPYRERLETWIAEQTASGHAVVHLSLHTFTPTFNNRVRNADIGLLFDPRRQEEKQICLAWQRQLKVQRPDLRVRRNYPYLGKADGLTTYLRKQMPENLYAGIELEVSQRWPKLRSQDWLCLRKDLARTLSQSIQLDSGK
jgi:predicted N-formylglutamate amidohydrolase